MPTYPGQPETRRYDVKTLRLSGIPFFENRHDFNSKNQKQAPVWNQARRIKRWIDPDAAALPADEIVFYFQYDPLKQVLKRTPMFAGDAATPNFPGTVSYAKWSSAPTPASYIGGGPLDPQLLSTRAEADRIAGEIGATSVRESASAPQIQWNGETRRYYVADWTSPTHGANTHALGLLLKERFRAGIDAPGKWELGLSNPVFVPDVPKTGEQDIRPEIPEPLRELYPNERLVHEMFGPQIERTDLVEQPSGGGSISAEVVGMIRETLENSRSIKNALVDR